MTPSRVISWPLSIEPYWRRVPGAVPLLHAIAEEPDDMTLRLILADLCDDVGETYRASFIRRLVQDSGRRHPGMSAITDPVRYYGVPEDEFARWFDGLPDIPRHDYRRQLRGGLLSYASFDNREFFAYADDVFRAADVHDLWIAPSAGDSLVGVEMRPVAGLDRLIRLRWMCWDRQDEIVALLAATLESGNLRELTLDRMDIGPDGLAVLLSSPGLRNIRQLSLKENPLGDRGCRVLAESGLTELERLDLEECGIGDEGMAALAASPVLSGVTALLLKSNVIGDVGAEALASSAYLASLDGLDLTENRIGAAGAAVLSRADSIGRLAWLSVADNPLGVNGIELMRGRLSERLTSGNLSSCGLVDSDIDRIGSLLPPGLTDGLFLSDNAITAAGARRLASLELLRGVESLSLEENPLGTVGVAVVVGSPFLDAVQNLSLGSTDLRPPFVPLAFPRTLTRLDVSYNPLGDDGAAWLAACEFGPGFAELTVAHAGIGVEGVRLLGQSPRLAGVRTLGLFGNPIGDAGIRALGESPLAPRLTHLLIWNVGLTWEGLEYLFRSGRFTALEWLDICDNDLTEDIPESVVSMEPLPNLRGIDDRDNPYARSARACEIMNRSRWHLRARGMSEEAAARFMASPAK